MSQRQDQYYSRDEGSPMAVQRKQTYSQNPGMREVFVDVRSMGVKN